MQGTIYQNGIHRELRQGEFGPYWSLATNVETAHMWPTMDSMYFDEAREEWRHGEESPPPAMLFNGRSRKKPTGEALHWDGMYAEFPGMGAVSSVEEACSSFPVSDLRPSFHRALDRDLYEHSPHECPPMWAHEVAETCPRYLRPEELAKKAGCTHREAIQLADALAILELSERAVKEICRWVRVRGIEATLRFLHPFLVAVAEVECPAPAPHCEVSPIIGFQDIPWYSEMSSLQLCAEIERRSAEVPRSCNRATLIATLMKLDQAELEGFMPGSHCRPLSEREDFSICSPETLEYARMGAPAEAERDWLQSSPAWFQTLITRLSVCRDIEHLKSFCSEVYDSLQGSFTSRPRLSCPHREGQESKRAWLVRHAPA